MIRRLVCRLIGHKWTWLKGAIPEDRATYRCDRCGVYGFYPARVGENEVPAEVHGHRQNEETGGGEA